MSPTERRWSGRSTRSSTRRSSSRIATRVSRWLPLIRISRFKCWTSAVIQARSVTRTRPLRRLCPGLGGRSMPQEGASPNGPKYIRRKRHWAVSSGASRSVVQLPQNLPRDHDPLDLAGPLTDLADLGVAHHPLHRILVGVAVAAEDLHRLGGGPHGQLGAEELGHRRLLLERPAVLLEPGGMVEQVGPGLDLRRHIGQLEADPLEAADRPAELLALPGVAQRLVVRSLRDSQAQLAAAACGPSAIPRGGVAAQVRPAPGALRKLANPGPACASTFSWGTNA